MPFVPRLSQNSPTPMRGNKWWYSSGNPFYAGGYGLPNCTCYAYGRYSEIRGAWVKLPTGNAGLWWGRAQGKFNCGQTPALGAVCCWHDPRGNYAGHVAIVEEILPNGDIITSNSAWHGTYFYTSTVHYADTGKGHYHIGYHGGAYRFQGFIYNVDQGGNAPIVNINLYVVAAICGNLKRESNINPGLWESLRPTSWDHQYAYDGVGGFGLGQWTNVGTPHGRCWNLHEWVTSNGYQDGDGNGQLAFIVHEDYWTNSSQKRGNYNNLTEFLQTDSTNLSDLTWDWCACWEGVPGNHFSERLEAAELIYQYFLAHMNDSSLDYTWISKNNYLTWDEMYNNAMCVLFWMSGGAIVPPPLAGRKKMPIWMMLRYFKK